jgi:hypothetical protein
VRAILKLKSLRRNLVQRNLQEKARTQSEGEESEEIQEKKQSKKSKKSRTE